jgi:hypothetical protein
VASRIHAVSPEEFADRRIDNVLAQDDAQHAKGLLRAAVAWRHHRK